ncbi:glutaredoxin family protein, partial [Pseudomonas aeruginosa]
MTTDVLLYTTNWCPFCRRAKALLKEKGVRWKELDIEADPAHRQAMAEASGRSSVLRIPRHSDTQPTLIRTPVPRSFGQAVGAQRRRGGIVS